MSEPRQGSGAIDRRRFIAVGVGATAASLIGADRATAHDHADDVICATVGAKVSASSLDAAALPAGRRFGVQLEPGARRPAQLREGQSIVVQLAEPVATGPAAVREGGIVHARGVTGLVVGTRDDIRGRASD